MNLYIIEHPTKGVVTDIPGDRDEKYHYSATKLRSDESTHIFNLIQARAHVSLCAKGSQIREWKTWKVVE